MTSRNDAALDAIFHRRSVSRFVDDVLPTAEELEALSQLTQTLLESSRIQSQWRESNEACAPLTSLLS